MPLPVPGNQNGQSLVQVLISVAIMGITMMAFATIMTNQQRETRALSEKLASIDLQRLLQISLADGTVCRHITNTESLTFDSTKVAPTNPQIVRLSGPIFASIQPGPPLVTGPIVAQIDQAISPYAQTAIVKHITLSVSGAPNPLPPPGPGVTFTGNWLITLDEAKLARPLAPISVSTTLRVDTTSPTMAKITDCQSGPISGLCPAGFMRIGTPGTPESYCISSAMEAPAPFLTAQTNCYNKPTRSHLCTSSEWQLACALGASGPNNMTGHYEWIPSTGYPGTISVAGAACDTGGHGAGSMSIGYRCCIR